MSRLLFLIAILPVWSSDSATSYWLALTAENAETSANWYRDKLGFAVFDKIDLPERGIHIRFLQLNGFHLEIVQRGDSFALEDKVPGEFRRAQVRGYFKFGLLVSDLDQLVTDLRGQAVSFYGEITEDERFGTRFAMVYDPDGNLIQLFEKLHSTGK